jgi:hypothetical protein
MWSETPAEKFPTKNHQLQRYIWLKRFWHHILDSLIYKSVLTQFGAFFAFAAIISIEDEYR